MNQKYFNSITMGDWLDYWYETYKKPILAKNSIRNYKQMIYIHTPQWLKNMPLKDISLLDIESALSSFKPSRTRSYLRQTWNNAFAKAVKMEIIPRNVVELSENIRYRKKTSKTLTKKELKDFVESLDGRRVKYAILFAVFSGARRSEVASLLWSDIDEDEKTIHIRGTKTESSDRYIPLTDDLKVVLDSQRTQAKTEKGTRFESKHPERVFDYNANYLSHVFKKICPNHHFHELRHTYITRCAECDINVNVCQQLVGHSTPQLTLSIYTHVLDDFKRREASKFSLFPT